MIYDVVKRNINGLCDLSHKSALKFNIVSCRMVWWKLQVLTMIFNNTHIECLDANNTALARLKIM